VTDRKQGRWRTQLGGAARDAPRTRRVSLIVADRWYASSKRCSDCGHKLDELDLGVRQWICPDCHTCHDRDVNAAINLRNSAVSSTIVACGGEGAGLAYKRMVKPSSMKQESNGKII
jgi:putative transposase